MTSVWINSVKRWLDRRSTAIILSDLDDRTRIDIGLPRKDKQFAFVPFALFDDLIFPAYRSLVSPETANDHQPVISVAPAQPQHVCEPTARREPPRLIRHGPAWRWFRPIGD